MRDRIIHAQGIRSDSTHAIRITAPTTEPAIIPVRFVSSFLSLTSGLERKGNKSAAEVDSDKKI